MIENIGILLIFIYFVYLLVFELIIPAWKLYAVLVVNISEDDLTNFHKGDKININEFGRDVKYKIVNVNHDKSEITLKRVFW